MATGTTALAPSRPHSHPRRTVSKRVGWAHPALTDMATADWDQLISTLTIPHQTQRATGLYIRRGGPPPASQSAGTRPRSASPSRPC